MSMCAKPTERDPLRPPKTSELGGGGASGHMSSGDDDDHHDPHHEAGGGTLKKTGKKRSMGEMDTSKAQARREANRVHAFKSRLRSKMLLADLQRAVEKLGRDKAELERQNAVLRAQMDVLKQQNFALIQSQQQLLNEQQEQEQLKQQGQPKQQEQDEQQQASSYEAPAQQAQVPRGAPSPVSANDTIAAGLTQLENVQQQGKLERERSLAPTGQANSLGDQAMTAATPGCNNTMTAAPNAGLAKTLLGGNVPSTGTLVPSGLDSAGLVEGAPALLGAGAAALALANPLAAANQMQMISTLLMAAAAANNPMAQNPLLAAAAIQAAARGAGGALPSQVAGNPSTVPTFPSHPTMPLHQTGTTTTSTAKDNTNGVGILGGATTANSMVLSQTTPQPQHQNDGGGNKDSAAAGYVSLLADSAVATAGPAAASVGRTIA